MAESKVRLVEGVGVKPTTQKPPVVAPPSQVVTHSLGEKPISTKPVAVAPNPAGSQKK